MGFIRALLAVEIGFGIAPVPQAGPLYAVLPGRPGNPLGARLIRLEGGSLIYGTNAPKSIGNAALFGCIRLVNDDIVDLAQRVSVGGRVVVSN